VIVRASMHLLCQGSNRSGSGHCARTSTRVEEVIGSTLSLPVCAIGQRLVVRATQQRLQGGSNQTVWDLIEFLRRLAGELKSAASASPA